MEYYVTLKKRQSCGVFIIDAYTAVYIGFHDNKEQAMAIATRFFGDNVEALFPANQREMMVRLRRIDNIVTLNTEHIVDDMTINNLISKSYENAKTKGFHNKKREHGTELMLLVSEASEALEATRNNNFANEQLLNNILLVNDDAEFYVQFKKYIKNSYEDEVADIFIRLGDLCGNRNINIIKHIIAKMRFNSMRKPKHGKEF